MRHARTHEDRGLPKSLDAVRFGIALWSRDGRFIDCNSAYREFYRTNPPLLKPDLPFGEFVEALIKGGELIEPPGDAGWISRHIDTFGTGQATEHTCADGRVLDVAQDISDTGVVVMTVRDVTLVRRAERALRAAKEIAEAADQSKSRFLRAASHDLRQPLAALKILIYNCATESEPSHRDDLLHAMDVSVSIMEDLLDALLQIGQLDAGNIVPKITTFQLAQVFGRLRVQFSHLATEKGLRLRILDTNVSVTTDRTLLERMLSNLIANAIRYTDTGAVLVGIRRMGGDVRVEVLDTGCGIAPEHVERIFDEFYQVHNSRRGKSRGLGLGLSIVKRLADLLELQVSVRSTPAIGSAFGITVPRGNVWQSELGEPAIEERIGGEFVGLCVCVVEDDGALRQAASNLLERWGIFVHAAASLEEARTLIEATGRPPDLILSDYSLRGQHGTEVVNQIRACVGVNVPSIIMTADTDPRLVETLKGQSFPVLIKPVSPPRLRVLMHNLLYEPQADR